MARLAMVIDAGKCLDCKGCQAACKVANDVPAAHWRNWIKSEAPDPKPGGKRMYFQPGNCMQCDRPSCVDACPTGATYKNKADGVVKIDRALCIGCGQCIKACPYGARYRDPRLKVADKCDFCADRRAVGLEPACVSTCPTKARVFGDLNDPHSEAGRLYRENRVSQIQAKNTDTKPNLYYLGETGPAHWAGEAEMPTAMATWKNVAGPLVKAFLGLTTIGVAVMWAKQIVLPNDSLDDAKKKPSVREDGLAAKEDSHD